MATLSVNINKIALLRNARAEGIPDVTTAAKIILNAGADGITLHPRPDRRHATVEDAIALRTLTTRMGRELNIEGNPLAAPCDGYPGLSEIARLACPDQLTFVPDEENQITSDHGWTLADAQNHLSPILKEIRSLSPTQETAGMPRPRISLFMDAETPATSYHVLRELGVDRVELYTKAYADLYKEHTLHRDHGRNTLEQYKQASLSAAEAGLGVNAGHDLDLQNLTLLVQTLPVLHEVSIGHALIADALYMGLSTVVRAYKRILVR